MYSHVYIIHFECVEFLPGFTITCNVIPECLGDTIYNSDVLMVDPLLVFNVKTDLWWLFCLIA